MPYFRIRGRISIEIYILERHKSIIQKSEVILSKITKMFVLGSKRHITIEVIMNNIKWFFFDIGSTLVEESIAYQNRIKKTIAGSNVTYEEFMDRLIQLKGDFKSVCALFAMKPAPWNSDDEVVYLEAAKCLRELSKRYKIGIIANQNLGSKERLEKIGLLKYIDLVIASAEEGVAKPNLRIFQIALERAKCKPEETVMVGDRIDNDIIPANIIGMITVWIRQGFGGLAQPQTAIETPDYTINNLNELFEIIE